MNGDLGPRLRAALDAWREAGRTPRFWLRDDDAVAPTPALDRLLDLSARHAVPAALAVIPARARPALARRLAEAPDVTVLVHGWSHENHAPDGQKKQELGPHRIPEAVLADLGGARERIDALFADQAMPILVPPWNRIDPALIPSLPALGFRGLSVFGVPRPGPLPVVNATVDIIDWHGTRGGRDHGVLADEIAAQLDACLADPSLPPVGLLTHHLVHDEAAWEFLALLFASTAGLADNPWRSIRTLL